MRRFFTSFLLSVVLSFSFIFSVQAQGSLGTLGKLPADVNADKVSFSQDMGSIVLEGNVVIKNEQATLFCNKAVVDKENWIAHCYGRVFVYQHGSFYAGTDSVYDFKNNKGESLEPMALNSPFYFRGEKIRRLSESLIVIDNATITTSAYAEPDYWVKAETVYIYPGIKAVANNAVMYVKGVPVFWFPKWTKYFDEDGSRFKIVPGRSSQWGEYLLCGYTPKFYPYKDVSIIPTFNVDYRSKRGFAGGVELEVRDLRAENRVNSDLLVYGLHDTDYEPIFGDAKDAKDNRYWINLVHKQKFLWDSSMILNFDLESDADVVYEYFRKDFENANQRTNYIDISRNIGKYFYLDIYAEGQLNDFNSVIERLPRITFNQVGTSLWDSNFYYGSTSSYANLKYAFSDRSKEALKERGVDPGKYKIQRVDTLHEISYAKKFFGWLNIEPWVGVEYTYFSDSPDGQDKNRMVYNPGVSLYTKFYRVFDVYSKSLNINRIRHILQPYITYDYIPEPNITPDELYQFDSIDAIKKKNRVELGLKNIFQTKRDDVSVDFFQTDIYTYLYPSLNASDTGERFSNIFWDNDLNLFDWLTVSFGLRYDPYKHEFVSFETNATVYQAEKWGVSLGHRYLDGTTNFITADINFVLTEEWAFKAIERYNYREGYSQEHEVSVFYDMHSWEAGLTYAFRRNVNRAGDDDHTFYLVIGLKEFPNSSIRGRV